MVKEIVKDVEILKQVSERFEFGEDDYLIQDMLDTAEYFKVNCLGLSAIQIGIPKRIIAVEMSHKFVLMINPVIIQKSTSMYKTTEGCLSLDGLREVRRHSTIKVAYTTRNKKAKVETFKGITAQIIQHEVDHLNGKLI